MHRAQMATTRWLGKLDAKPLVHMIKVRISWAERTQATPCGTRQILSRARVNVRTMDLPGHPSSGCSSSTSS